MKLIKSISKKTIIISAIAVLLAACVVLVGFTGRRTPQGAVEDTIRTISLERGDMQRTISATGTVYSTNVTNIYSTLSHTVKTVNVEVGDRVNVGDILAELDTTSIERDIEQKKINLSNSQATAYQNLTTARNDLSNYQRNIESGYDTSLLKAESDVTTAELNLQSAEIDVTSKQTSVREARRKYLDARDGTGSYENEYVTDQQLEDLRKALVTAESNLEQALITLEQRKQALEQAKASLEAAKIKSSDDMQTKQSTVRKNEISANFDSDLISLQKLEEDLEKCIIKTPVSGVITSVNAIEGGSGSGMLFVIQDDTDLKIVTNIKEYDIGSISIGNKVIIKADATGDKEFAGTLSKIAPTSLLTASGGTSNSTEAQYESEVAVSQSKGGLLIGMNTRLSIVVEERKNIFNVPYEALTEQEGQWFVYVRETGEDGNPTSRLIPVEKGMENNLYAEISGDELVEGMTIVKNALDIIGRPTGGSGMFGGMMG